VHSWPCIPVGGRAGKSPRPSWCRPWRSDVGPPIPGRKPLVVWGAPDPRRRSAAARVPARPRGPRIRKSAFPPPAELRAPSPRRLLRRAAAREKRDAVACRRAIHVPRGPAFSGKPKRPSARRKIHAPVHATKRSSPVPSGDPTSPSAQASPLRPAPPAQRETRVAPSHARQVKTSRPQLEPIAPTFAIRLRRSPLLPHERHIGCSTLQQRRGLPGNYPSNHDVPIKTTGKAPIDPWTSAERTLHFPQHRRPASSQKGPPPPPPLGVPAGAPRPFPNRTRSGGRPTPWPKRRGMGDFLSHDPATKHIAASSSSPASRTSRLTGADGFGFRGEPRPSTSLCLGTRPPTHELGRRPHNHESRCSLEDRVLHERYITCRAAHPSTAVGGRRLTPRSSRPPSRPSSSDLGGSATSPGARA